MHLIETFATSTGLKIDKPYIHDSFFPLPSTVKKYISLQATGSTEAKRYDHWNILMGLLRERFNKEDIAVVQIGLKSDPEVKGVVDLRGKTNINQAAYIIKNSVLHLGADSFGIHMASHYNKKIVGLYSVSPPSEVGPYWTNEEDCVLLSGIKSNEKYSYFTAESPKTINRITTEEIARGIFKLLNMEFNYQYETVYIGKDSHLPRVELVPDNFIENWKQLNVDSLIVRMDKHYNIQNLAHQLKVCKCSIITDKEIDINLIRTFRDNVIEMVYYVDEKSDTEYIKHLKATGVDLYVLSKLKEEDLNKIKIKYLDVSPIFQKEDLLLGDIEELSGKKLEDLFYINPSRIISNQGFRSAYGTEPLPQGDFHLPQPVVDKSEFWADLDRMIILEKTS